MNVYQDRPVLVIGGMGFIGSHVTQRLCASGARVTVVTRSLEGRREAAAELRARGVRVIEGDLRDADVMREAVGGQAVIFNLAGESGAVQSMEDPFTDLDVNCRGNLTLLEALRAVNREARVLFVGSRLEYGRVGGEAVAEEHPTDPLCLHAVHKLAVEQYLQIYRRLFGVKFTSVRLTNPYGPGQPRERTAYGVVNRLIHLALSGDDLTIYGDGQQRRDYIYIDDAVDALLALAAAPAAEGRIYNVGAGVGTPLIEMARIVIELTGRGRVRQIAWPPLAEQVETGDFVADIARIHADIGWRPTATLRDGLARTIHAYRAQVAS
jgi:UDP-glucose 4-epimerase